MNDTFFHLQCVTCRNAYDETEIEYTCPDCGPVKGTLDVVYDFRKVKRKFNRIRPADSNRPGHWRYLPLLPVLKPELIQPLRAGWTPLYHIKKLNTELGLPGLYLKDDSGNVTHSYKDRASSVAIVKALEKGYKGIAAASSGNAAASISAFAACAGLPCHIYVPKTIPQAKLAQLRAYKADVILVDGPYDEAFELCLKEAPQNNWYNRNTAINPYLAEGKKTGALEICEQLDWQAPDVVAVSVGDGCIISGVWKGFKDFYDLGFIDSLPRLVGVQAEHSAPLTEAFMTGRKEIVPRPVCTIADSICVGFPRDQVKALRAVHQSGGMFISVSDPEIISAIKMLSGTAGVFVEPAAAASFAGVLKLRDENKISEGQTIAALLTGSGLKDIGAVTEN